MSNDKVLIDDADWYKLKEELMQAKPKETNHDNNPTRHK